MRRADNLDWCVERIEPLVGHQRGDVGGGAAARVVFVHDHQVVRLGDRGQDRRVVERRECARVHDLGLDALPGQFLGRGQRLVDHARDGHDRDVTTGPLDVGLAQRDAPVVVGHLTFHTVEHLVLEDDHQVVVADGAQEQAPGIGRGRRDHRLDAGHVGEDRVVAAGVLAGRVQAGADHGADDQRAFGFAAEHVAQLGALVEDLVHAAAEEVDEHQLGDGAQPGRGGADGRPDEAGFGDRRVEHARAAELLDQALGHAQHATPSLVLRQVIDGGAAGHVLAHEDNSRVLAHGDVHRLIDGLAVRELSCCNRCHRTRSC